MASLDSVLNIDTGTLSGQQVLRRSESKQEASDYFIDGVFI